MTLPALGVGRVALCPLLRLLGLAAQAAQFLTNAGLITVLDRPLWNTSAVLREDSLVGRVLHALVGYTDRPSGMQVLVYLGTILVMVALMQVSSTGKRRQLRTA